MASQIGKNRQIWEFGSTRSTLEAVRVQKKA